jgi:hypothetical protein
MEAMVYQEYCFGPCVNLETGLGNKSKQNALEGLAHTSLCQEVFVKANSL